MQRKSSVLDSSGNPYVILTHDEALRRPMQRSSYDAARTSSEFENYWANADRLNADSAHSRGVRETLVSRSRYEVGNNGFSDGIAQTYATDLIGVGPNLRMQTKSKPFNQLVEANWRIWTKLIQFRRKFWCMAHAKHQDGEGLGVIRLNPKIRRKYPIALDVCLYETEQFQTPHLPFTEGYIDGIKFDKFGNVQHYDLLPYHPGSSEYHAANNAPEQIPADRVLHWFKMRRPGQHRAVPECASTLNTGAASRRWREATIAAAETAADFTLFLKTQMKPEEFEGVAPLSTLDIEKRMMTALPDGYDPFQMKAEHPTANYEGFLKSQINEQARPKSMPYNKAACDSSNYNYASGRLDHQTYYADLDVEREDANDLVLDPLFDLWFDYAISAFGWLGGDPTQVGVAARAHTWDWPQHKVADIKAEATSNQIKLESGQISLPALYSETGRDLEDEIPQMARAYGIDEAEMRSRLLEAHFPSKTPEAAPQEEDEGDASPVEASELFKHRLNGLTNGNGATNGKH